MDTIKRGWIALALIFLCSCNFPTNKSPGQDINLLETVQALNTLVAERSQAPTQAPPTQQPAAPSSTLTPTSGSTSPPPVAIAHKLTPGEPGWVERWFLDTNSSITAADKRAPGGDDFSKNVFERPFTAQDMTYRPDIDINKAEISSDANFIYVTIYLNGTNPQGGGLQGWYGVELDTDLDGRGNYLLLAANPEGSTWKIENVTAFKDSGKKVGGAHPMQPDPPTGYTGYDQVIFSVKDLVDPDAAWARISPKGSAIVDLAFKRSLVDGADKFLWNVWTDDGVKNPASFDYNDHFSASEAGSPFKGADYPLKALAQVDNTCRETYRFTPTTDIPGLCSPPKNKSLPAEPPPGGGSWGALTTDLAVASIFLKSLPEGTLSFRLQNNGPASLPSVKVICNCSYIIYSYTDGSVAGGYKNRKEVSLNLTVGQSTDVETVLDLNPQLARYEVTCYYEPNFKDPILANDSLTVSFPPPP